MECGKRIPLELKVIETWQIKKYIHVAQGQEAEVGIFTRPYLPVNIKGYSLGYFSNGVRYLY